MTITLNPRLEAKLMEKAFREGQDPNAIANDVLSYFLEADALENQVSTEDVREAIGAERAKPIKEYIGEQRAKLGYSRDWPARDAVQETAPGVFVDQM